MPARTENPFVEDLSRAGVDILKVLRALKDSAIQVHAHMARMAMEEMDLVTRDEFESTRDMALEALRENEKLARRIAALEARLGLTATTKPAKSAPRKQKPKRASSIRHKSRSKKP
ncbi:MAG TPA: hypothetical protein DCW68_01535 [Rhodospirillaceae bacterium]|nr:hypothetical protein [Rhodospirillaceae bacterium]